MSTIYNTAYILNKGTFIVLNKIPPTLYLYCYINLLSPFVTTQKSAKQRTELQSKALNETGSYRALLALNLVRVQC